MSVPLAVSVENWGPRVTGVSSVVSASRKDHRSNLSCVIHAPHARLDGKLYVKAPFGSGPSGVAQDVYFLSRGQSGPPCD